MRIKIFVIIMAFFTLSSWAQDTLSMQWSQCFGGSQSDYGFFIHELSDNNLLFVCYSGSNDFDVLGNHGSRDAWLIKANYSGEILWSRCYGGSGDDQINSLKELPDGSFIAAGETNSTDGDVHDNFGNSDFWILNLSSDGEIIWSKCYGGTEDDFAYSIIQSAEGFLVCGESNSSDGYFRDNRGDSDAWIMSINFEGDTLFTWCLGGSEYDGLYSLRHVSDDEYLAYGSTNSSDGDITGNHGNTDIWLTKFTEDNVILWSRCYGGSNTDEAGSIVLSEDGEIFIAAYTHSNDGDVHDNHSSAGYRDALVLRLNRDGDTLWSKCYGGSQDDIYPSISLINDNIILAFSTNSFNGDISGLHGFFDAFICQTDQDGNILHSKTLGGSQYDYSSSVLTTTDNKIYLSGSSRSTDLGYAEIHGESDCWITKFSLSESVSEPPLTNLPESMSLSAYPNPFNSSVSIELPTKATDIEIYDINGKLCHKASAGSTTYTWQPSQELESGVYNITTYMKDIEYQGKVIYIK